MTRLLATLAAATVGVLAFGGSASAVPITQIDGTINSYTITKGAGNNFSLNFGASAITQLNGAVVTSISTAFAPTSGTQTGVTFTFSGVPFSETVAGAPNAIFSDTTTSSLFATGAGNTSSLQLSGGKILLTAGSFGALTTNDFTPFFVPGASFIITLNSGQNIANFLTSASTGATLTGSGSFSQTVSPDYLRLLQVPEPATLAICGIFGIAGLVGARRKLKKSVEPTVAA